MNKRLPEPGVLAGYAALIKNYDLRVPIPRRLRAIGEQHRIVEYDEWTYLTPRHAPAPTLEGHLVFALKYEGLDLAVLKALFLSVGSDEVTELVRKTPTGSYSRRIWFLYEWLLAKTLDIPDTTRGHYVDALDESLQLGVKSVRSKRHRVNNNMPGNPQFCPLVGRTNTVSDYLDKDLSSLAREITGRVPRDLLARAAAFLLVQDSRASFNIENEQPSASRLQRWGQAISQAGQAELQIEELERLQKLVVESRFVRLGLRKEGGFVGEHDRATRMPIPVHISARSDDLGSLLEGFCEFERSYSALYDPMVAAAVLAFGFVYIHPFEDGNGRIHRYLIHHVLTRCGFHPKGMIFPISAAILNFIDEYREVLESYSERLLPIIEWEATQSMNINVTSQSADWYRFFDATPHVEFLFKCAEYTILKDLPEEAEFLRRYDLFRARINELVDMPESTINLLFHFLKQNEGRLSKRALNGEFSAFETHEVEHVESIFAELFPEQSNTSDT